MERKQFNDEIDKIPVPHTHVQSAIRKGIEMAQHKKPVKKNRIKTILIASVLLVGFFGSGFVVPQMTSVLAKAPIIGKIYASFYEPVGQQLVMDDLVTELDQRQESNGIGVTVNSVYYDGGQISVTFKVDNVESNVEVHYIHHTVADGSEKWSTASISDLRETPDGLVGYLQIFYPEKELPQDATLPFTFTSIDGIEGKWEFNIPIKQLENKKIDVAASTMDANNEYGIKFDSVTIGKASAVLDYTAIHPLTGENDFLRIQKVTDDKGNDLSILLSGMQFDKKEIDGQIEAEDRTIIGKVPEDAKYLMIYPAARVVDTVGYHSLGDKTPFTLYSERSDVELSVMEVEQDDRELIVTYSLQNADKRKSLEELVNFGENMDIVDSSFAGVEVIPLGHNIKGSKVKVLDEKNYVFQATFELDGPAHFPEAAVENFSLEGYSLMVPFSIALPMKELPPIKVTLQ